MMKIEDLKKIGETATPAPWVSNARFEQGFYSYTAIPNVDGWSIIKGSFDFKDSRWNPPKFDSDFIAAARNNWDKIMNVLEAVKNGLKDDILFWEESYCSHKEFVDLNLARDTLKKALEELEK